MHLFESWLAGEVDGLDHLLDVTPESNRNEVVHLNREEIRVLYITRRIVRVCELRFFEYKGPHRPPALLACSVCSSQPRCLTQGLKCDVRLVPHEVALHQ